MKIKIVKVKSERDILQYEDGRVPDMGWRQGIHRWVKVGDNYRVVGCREGRKREYTEDGDICYITVWKSLTSGKTIEPKYTYSDKKKHVLQGGTKIVYFTTDDKVTIGKNYKMEDVVEKPLKEAVRGKKMYVTGFKDGLYEGRVS